MKLVLGHVLSHVLKHGPKHILARRMLEHMLKHVPDMHVLASYMLGHVLGLKRTNNKDFSKKCFVLFFMLIFLEQLVPFAIALWRGNRNSVRPPKRATTQSVLLINCNPNRKCC